MLITTFFGVPTIYGKQKTKHKSNGYGKQICYANFWKCCFISYFNFHFSCPFNAIHRNISSFIQKDTKRFCALYLRMWRQIIIYYTVTGQPLRSEIQIEFICEMAKQVGSSGSMQNKVDSEFVLWKTKLNRWLNYITRLHDVENGVPNKQKKPREKNILFHLYYDEKSNQFIGPTLEIKNEISSTKQPS